MAVRGRRRRVPDRRVRRVHAVRASARLGASRVAVVLRGAVALRDRRSSLATLDRSRGPRPLRRLPRDRAPGRRSGSDRRRARPAGLTTRRDGRGRARDVGLRRGRRAARGDPARRGARPRVRVPRGGGDVRRAAGGVARLGGACDRVGSVAARRGRGRDGAAHPRRRSLHAGGGRGPRGLRGGAVDRADRRERVEPRDLAHVRRRVALAVGGARRRAPCVRGGDGGRRAAWFAQSGDAGEDGRPRPAERPGRMGPCPPLDRRAARRWARGSSICRSRSSSAPRDRGCR